MMQLGEEYLEVLNVIKGYYRFLFSVFWYDDL